MYDFFFDSINGLLENMALDGSLNLTFLNQNIRKIYTSLRKSGMSKEEIHSEMVSLFNSKNDRENLMAAEILFAYFVQLCEVYDATT